MKKIIIIIKILIDLMSNLVEYIKNYKKIAYVDVLIFLFFMINNILIF